MTYDRGDVEKKFEDLIALVGPGGQPNINAIWRLAKDIELIKLNIKFFGYELARRMADALPPVSLAGGPRMVELQSKASTQADLEAEWTRYWSGELKIAHVFHRKIWELAYVLQAIHQSGFMRPGARGLGFGCGEEPLPSYLAAKGCRITVTDMPPENQMMAGWAATNQYATLEKSYKSEFLQKDEYDRLVDFRYVDMNNIGLDLADYDFCWSICAFEHLGSIAKGVEFIQNAMRTIKSGGLSIHTTEYNFISQEHTIDHWPTVLYQRQHFEEMARRLTVAGHKVAPLNFDIGSKPLDKFIDLPPFGHDWSADLHAQWGAGLDHIKVAVDGFASTCFGLIVQKA